ncbi:MAG: DUF2063 domain-containing protein, partial [Halioglobus sp.]|nr:DUF2063 domain-containing protein [Halioglobus sp.]
AWLLRYQYPVHRIGPAFRPMQPEQPAYLVVYRDRGEKVRFMELNPMSARLVELTRDNSSATVRDLLATLAAESGLALPTVLESGTQQIADLLECGVLGPAPAGD